MFAAVPLLLLGARSGSAVFVGVALAVSSAINSAVDLGVASRVMKIPLREVAVACMPSFVATGAMAVVLAGYLRMSGHAVLASCNWPAG